MQDEGYSVGDVTRLINRRRRLISVTSFVIIAISAIVAYSLETLYMSSGAIIIDQPEVADQFLPGTYQAPNREQRIARINDEVMTRENLASIVETHNLYPEERGSNEARSVVGELRENFELEMILAEDDPRNRYACWRSKRLCRSRSTTRRQKARAM